MLTKNKISTFLVFLISTLWILGVGEGVAVDQNLTDKAINNAVMHQLVTDKSVSAHLIDVETENGVVTLSGSTDNLLARERAVKIAQSIKGVRVVVNNIEVKSVPRADAEIMQDVKSALHDNPVTDSLEIQVQVDQGVVTLMGQVESWQEKQFAARVAKNVKGIVDARNQIDFKLVEERPDSEIQSEVAKRLAWDVLVDEGLIDVQVDDGEVRLSGTVGSLREKARAYRDGWVAGVTAVNTDELKINWTEREALRRTSLYPKLSDEQIEQAIEEALVYDPRIRFFNPVIEVEEGIAKISGTVSDLQAKRAAEQDAKQTVWVWRVKNFIKVRPDLKLSDDEIEENIQNALRRDPVAEGYEIVVSVFKGKAFLSGNVESRYEKRHVEDVVSGINGVVEISNNISIAQTAMMDNDWQLKQEITHKLVWEPVLDIDDIQVTVQDGVVTLSGKVKYWYLRQLAAEKARASGAREVRNQLQVKYGPVEFLATETTQK